MAAENQLLSGVKGNHFQLRGCDLYALDLSTLRFPHQNALAYQFSGGDILLLLADSAQRVSMPAALPASLEKNSKTDLSLEKIWNWLQDNHSGDDQAGLFLSLFRPGTRSLDYICYNIPEPIRLKCNGQIEDLTADSSERNPLTRKFHNLVLGAGDLIILFDSLLIELKNKFQENFGLMSLKSLILQNRHLTAEELGLTISQAAWLHHGQISMESLNLVILKIPI